MAFIVSNGLWWKKIHRSEKKNAKKFGGYGTILYFCIVLTLKSYVICDLKRLGVYIHKALLDALVLTVEELRKLIWLSKTKQRERPKGVVLYYTCIIIPLWWCGSSIYASAWGFRRCSFRQSGQCEGLSTVERVTELAPRFVHICNKRNHRCKGSLQH